MIKEPFSWSSLGDIQTGRPNLGLTTRVEVYRLMQYTMRAILVDEYGDPVTRQLLSKAGRLAGVAFCNNMMDVTLPLNKFIASLHELLKDLSIGILRVEKIEPETLNIIVTISEDLDCSGLPVNGYTVCDYDEGFLEGVFEVYTGKVFEVREIDCWSTGDRTCRFTIKPV